MNLPPDDTGDPLDEEVASNLIMLPGARLEANPPGPVSVEDDLAEEPGDLRPPAPHLVEGAVEALLLAAADPISEADMDRWLGNPGKGLVREALLTLGERYRRSQGGIRLLEVAKGWQLRTDVRFAPWVAAMRGGKPVRLSRAGLETLAMVAYRQPITRSEVEDLRGVDSGGVLRMLVERGMVAVAGRKDEPGRPLLYGTTPAFLAMFGLRDLSDLPTLRDLREMRSDDPREGPVPVEGEDWGEDDDTVTTSNALPLQGQQLLPLLLRNTESDPPVGDA